MKKHLAATIVRYRILILLAVLAVAVWSAFQIGRTNINYDVTRYLSDDTMTKRALAVMREEFGATEQIRIMFENQNEDTINGIVRQLRDMPEILAAQYEPAADRKQVDGTIYQLVTLTLNDCDTASLITSLRTMFPEAGHYLVGGSAADQLDVQRIIGAEIPGIMSIAVGVVCMVLLITSHAWLEPLLLMVVFAISILINMGTNFLFPDVSFITFAVCAILQLALSIDYAIMLLHTWNGFCDTGLSPEEAMTDALAQCFMRIASSAFTTAAGLLSLLFMSFSIGFDIGLVLTKGIIISMLGVFLLMPSLTLLMKNLLHKTRHRPIRFGGEKMGLAIYAGRKPVAAVMIAIVLCGAFFSFQNKYTFTEAGDSFKTESGRISGLFGTSNPLVLLVPGDESDEEYDRQRETVQTLQILTRENGSPMIGQITAMVTTGEAALKKYTPAETAEMTGVDQTLVSLFFTANGFGESVRADRLLDAAETFAGGNESIRELKTQLQSARKVFIGKRYHRLLLEPAFDVTDPDFSACMGKILETVRQIYGDQYYITGGPMSTYDIGNAFRSDLMKVNLITLLSILLIVILSFRSFVLPVILVFVIEGAIWITMGISCMAGQPLFFISYLICLSIQMGATIDYGILVSDQYRIFRGKGLTRKDAIQQTLHTALPTVLTSGIILITAGFIIGKQCSVYYISSIGLLISRGALMSVILVLTLLPALLLLMDRFVCRKRRERKERGECI